MSAVVGVTAGRLQNSAAELGTGFVISVDGDSVSVLTARHLFFESKERFVDNISVRFHSRNESYKAELIADSPNVDLAILKILRVPLSLSNSFPVFAVRPDNAPAVIGEALREIGGPSEAWRTSSFSITYDRDEDHPDRFWFVGEGILAGLSGAPLIDSNNRLTAVHLGTIADHPNVGHAQRLSYAYQALPLLARMNKLKLDSASAESLLTDSFLRGFKFLEFGRSVAQISRIVPGSNEPAWLVLPQAKAYRKTEVRYINTPSRDFGQFFFAKDTGCVPSSSSIDLFFAGSEVSQQLFRITLNFPADSTCGQQELFFTKFAREYKLDVVHAPNMELFEKRLPFLRLIGNSSNGQASITLIRPLIADTSGDLFAAANPLLTTTGNASPAELVGTWRYELYDPAGPRTSYQRVWLRLRADGTYLKSLDAMMLKTYVGGTHSGTWKADGMSVTLSGDGNWPVRVEDLGRFQKVE